MKKSDIDKLDRLPTIKLPELSRRERGRQLLQNKIILTDAGLQMVESYKKELKVFISTIVKEKKIKHWRGSKVRVILCKKRDI